MVFVDRFVETGSRQFDAHVDRPSPVLKCVAPHQFLQDPDPEQAIATTGIQQDIVLLHRPQQIADQVEVALEVVDLLHDPVFAQVLAPEIGFGPVEDLDPPQPVPLHPVLLEDIFVSAPSPRSIGYAVGEMAGPTDTHDHA